MDERNTGPGRSLLEEIDGPVLVELGNWLASSLDISELKPEQVLLLHTILAHCLERLWDTFPEVLAPLASRIMALLMEEDDES